MKRITIIAATAIVTALFGASPAFAASAAPTSASSPWFRLQSVVTGKYVVMISSTGRIVQEPRKVTPGTDGRFIPTYDAVIIAKNTYLGQRHGKPWRIFSNGPTGNVNVHFTTYHGKQACSIGFTNDTLLTSGNGLLYLRSGEKYGPRNLFYIRPL